MAWLPDEQWDMVKDSIDKKNIARSAHKRRSHNGKGGSVKFPSDYLTKKELKSMNGEIKTYNISKPMNWGEFKQLPDDLKAEWVKTLREKYDIPNKDLAEYMGVHPGTLYKWLKCLGLGDRKASGHSSTRWQQTDNCKTFKEFWNGYVDEPSEETIKTEAEQGCYPIELPHTVPESGSLCFNCNVDEALEIVKSILGSNKMHMTITWVKVD